MYVCNGYTTDDKDSCIPVIDDIIHLANITRKKGVLALEEEIQDEDEFFLKFGTFKKCILIKYLLEQGYRNILFVDDDSIIINPVNFKQTRVKPVCHIELSYSEAAKAVGCTAHNYEAAVFVLDLSEDEVKIYVNMFV
jgi:hypothetical protein